MKTKKVLLITSLLSAMSFAGMANAEALNDSVTINFTGVFQSTTCNINLNNSDVTDNGSVDLYLGFHSTTDIVVNADATPAVPFTVDFSECGAISEANITFSGTQTEPRLFDVSGNSQGNVGIGVNTSETADNYIAIGENTPVVITDGAGSIDFYARYVKIGDEPVVDGEANAVATMDIIYG